MDTYIMNKELFIDLIKKAKKISSMYTLPQIVAASLGDLDIRGIAHRGYFASITDFNSYYNANLSLIDIKTAEGLSLIHIFSRKLLSKRTCYSSTVRRLTVL